MIISIFGKAGCGKTTLLKSIIDNLHSVNHKKVYYWSPYPDDNPDKKFKIETNSIIGISEFHIFYEINRKKIETKIDYIFTGYRHLNVDIIIDSQRPALVPRVVTALSSYILCFQITEKRDIEYLSFYSGKASILPTLPRYKYINIL